MQLLEFLGKDICCISDDGGARKSILKIFYLGLYYQYQVSMNFIDLLVSAFWGACPV